MQKGVREIDIMWDETKTKASSWRWRSEGAGTPVDDVHAEEEEVEESVVVESSAGQEE